MNIWMGVVGNDETPAGEGLRRDPTGSDNDRGGLPVPPQESELFPTTPRLNLMVDLKSLIERKIVNDLCSLPIRTRGW